MSWEIYYIYIYIYLVYTWYILNRGCTWLVTSRQLFRKTPICINNTGMPIEVVFFFFQILGRIGTNKAWAHHTSSKFRFRVVRQFNLSRCDSREGCCYHWRLGALTRPDWLTDPREGQVRWRKPLRESHLSRVVWGLRELRAKHVRYYDIQHYHIPRYLISYYFTGDHS